MEVNKKFVDELRTKSGYTTKKFAEIAGISPESYYAIMSNKNASFSYKSIVQLAVHFNLPINDFLMSEMHINMVCKWEI